MTPSRGPGRVIHRCHGTRAQASRDHPSPRRPGRVTHRCHGKRAQASRDHPSPRRPGRVTHPCHGKRAQASRDHPSHVGLGALPIHVTPNAQASRCVSSRQRLRAAGRSLRGLGQLRVRRRASAFAIAPAMTRPQPWRRAVGACLATVRTLPATTRSAVAAHALTPLSSHPSADIAEAAEAPAPAGLALLTPRATWAGATREDEPGYDDAASLGYSIGSARRTMMDATRSRPGPHHERSAQHSARRARRARLQPRPGSRRTGQHPDSRVSLVAGPHR